MSSLARIRAVGNVLLHRAGIDAIRLASPGHPLGRRRRLLEELGVDLVIDVGANEGQYARELRRIGYRGRILSFEPLLDPFRVLTQHAGEDPMWEAMRFAIGPTAGEATLNVAANRGLSSSFLPMLREHIRNAPDAQYVGTEGVVIRRLDDVCRAAVGASRATFLKADVQGYELEVLASATGILPSVIGLQLEMSLIPLYAGAPTLISVLEHARTIGFDLVGLEPGFVAADGRLLQTDGLFERSGLRK